MGTKNEREKQDSEIDSMRDERRQIFEIEELILRRRNNTYYPNKYLERRKRQEIKDELLEKEKMFGALINYQRDQEKYE